ncbi:hypothetical protein KUTeg_000969 [Tegillarca granosa]|uniref:Uncharacterized protein n=1 Tax=Tegillarca granosa TaxID=220873 RepID=A0ABQ9G0J5_TEGGR|nr:hypothetical protein KUTeg_000969 [Tegillarca granosa]
MIMPSNEDFNLQILVGPSVLPEYQHDGQTYVESNLFTPYSYKQQAQQLVSGEVEAQKWPVTPFMISIEAKPNTPPCYYRVSIDGQKVKGISLYRCEKRVIKGFKDGTVVREFLFSLPRFAKDLDDRIDITCRHKVGIIEVECYNAKKRQSQKRLQAQSLAFEQANKKDSSLVTNGKYLMTTTKAGRVIHSRNAFKTTDFWDISSLRSKLTVKYVTKETLQEMGLVVIPIPFPITHFPGSRGSLPQVKCELLDGGTVVLDLTGEIPGCSSSMSDVKIETDSSMNENNNNPNSSMSTRTQTFSLPAEMNNTTIDLTEDEEMQNSETIANNAENISCSAVEKPIAENPNEENNSSEGRDKRQSGNEEQEMERATKKRKISHESAENDSEGGVTGVTNSNEIVKSPAKSVTEEIDNIVAQLENDKNVESEMESSSGMALESENVQQKENKNDSNKSVQIKESENSSENDKEKTDTDVKNLNDTVDKNVEDNDTGNLPDNDNESGDQIKEGDNENDKEKKDTDVENLNQTVKDNVEDTEIDSLLDNDSESDNQNDNQDEKDKDNEN